MSQFTQTDTRIYNLIAVFKINADIASVAKTKFCRKVMHYAFTFVICVNWAQPAFSKVAPVYCVSTITDTLAIVPIGGNTWRTDKDTTGGNISDEGIVNWTDQYAGFTAYFRLGSTGKFKLYLNIAVPEGKSKIGVTALGTTKEVTVSARSSQDVYIGE